jgi:hypothetical protein
MLAFLAFLVLTLSPVFKAARKNPTPKTRGMRNVAVAFLAFALLVSGAYALGKDLAQRDARADRALCKP